MNELVVVDTYRNVPISYDSERKQFVARVGMKDIRKPSQRAVELVILKYQGGIKTKRVMHIRDGYWRMELMEVEAIGAKGSKILYRRPGRDEVDSLDSDHTYDFDPVLFGLAQQLLKNQEDWNKRYEKLVERMKKVDVKDFK